ncbi:GntR family transcriptional regulator [Specibacter cremeus]|uniref:GntR family transcriptional regulator n=1 Tax=Specibacter cremeus TaxID=1629051 RepID=UPI0013DE1410|nr:GntR family transcriptional regulator [Specibacter cremeus]
MTEADSNLLVFESATPLYRQIAERLYSEIASGRLAPGAALGSEADLQEQFGVSRVTLRQAVGLLVEQGLVVRKQGKGTFVEASPLKFPLDTLEGTTQLATTLGRPTTSQVTRMQAIKGSSVIRQLLDTKPDENLIQVCRLDFAGDQPLAFATIHLPERIGSRLTKQELEHEALYPLLERTQSEIATQADETIQAAGASKEVAERLGIPVGAPILTVARTTRNQHNVPIEYSVIDFRANALQFSISLRRRMGEFSVPYRFQEHLRFGDAEEPQRDGVGPAHLDQE